jgi:hypothetical protein
VTGGVKFGKDENYHQPQDEVQNYPFHAMERLSWRLHSFVVVRSRRTIRSDGADSDTAAVALVD